MTAAMKVVVINGPNLNLLERRDPRHYGGQTLEQINSRLMELGRELGVELTFFQSNHEGELVEALQAAGREGAGVVLNAGAYTHTSVAVRDAVEACGAMVVEVHLSNHHAREDFRKSSLLSGVVSGEVTGFGWASYALALTWLARYSGHGK
jgi:3-dehydroquinate dehydratase-2